MGRQEDALRKFGQQLTYLREQKNISIDELAIRCGLDPRQIGRIEAGEVDFPLTTIIALAAGLGVPPGELLQSP